nr:MAG TPA: Protein yfhF, Fe-S cluster, iron, sulfur.3A [Caudoviricetes sp.]
MPDAWTHNPSGWMCGCGTSFSTLTDPVHKACTRNP